MISFKGFLKESIIIPEVPKIDFKKIKPGDEINNIVFYHDDSNRCGGYKNGIIEVNLFCIKTEEDMFNFIFHESIHHIQDIKSIKNIHGIISKKLFSISKKEMRKIYRIVNPFEIMAYATTFAVFLKTNYIPLKDFSKSLEQSKFKEVFKIIQGSMDYKKFKKYLYL
jgi:hypothetical protein